MAKKTTKRRLKKPVKAILIAVPILVILGLLSFNGGINKLHAIQGYFTLDKEPPAENPNIQTFFLNYSEKPVKLGNGRWTIYQRYQVQKDDYCKIDCANICIEKDLDYYKAYSQEWGVCRCKCEITQDAT